MEVEKKKKMIKRSLAGQIIVETKDDEQEVSTEEKKLEEVMTVLDDLKGKVTDIQLCPRCKSPKVRRVGSGDMTGQMAMTLPKYECLECGWRGRLILYATNRAYDEKSMATVS